MYQRVPLALAGVGVGAMNPIQVEVCKLRADKGTIKEAIMLIESAWEFLDYDISIKLAGNMPKSIIEKCERMDSSIKLAKEAAGIK
jgi:hypothetical protein